MYDNVNINDIKKGIELTTIVDEILVKSKRKPNLKFFFNSSTLLYKENIINIIFILIIINILFLLLSIVNEAYNITFSLLLLHICLSLYRLGMNCKNIKETNLETESALFQAKILLGLRSRSKIKIKK